LTGPAPTPRLLGVLVDEVRSMRKEIRRLADAVQEAPPTPPPPRPATGQKNPKNRRARRGRRLAAASPPP